MRGDLIIMSKRFGAIALLISILVAAAFSQDSQELKAEREANARLKGEHPLIAIAKSKPSSLRPELVGVHPRVYMTQAEIDKLKEKTVTQKEMWQTACRAFVH